MQYASSSVECIATTCILQVVFNIQEKIMSPELFWLTLYTLLTALMVLPYAVFRTKKLGGIIQVFKTPLPGDSPIEAPWAHRAYRAHMNAFESLVLFAPLAIIVHITDSSSTVTSTASAIFFWARLVYAPLYYFDVAYLKTSAWSIAYLTLFVIAFQLLF